MRRLKLLNTNNKRIMVALSLALVLLVTNTLKGTSSLQLIKPAMAKKLITTADIADNAVTSPKIKDGEVKTSDIEDGTITSDDVSPALMIRKALGDNEEGHAHGWNPDNTQRTALVTDPDIGPTQSIFVDIEVFSDLFNVCSVTTVRVFTHELSLACTGPIGEGASLQYVITKLPISPMTSTASASPTSSSTPTISSPFSSIGDH
jgi:hypothetical protein